MILAIIAIALVAFIGLGLYNANKLQTIQIKKSVTKDGTMEQTFDMVKYLNNFPKWSPFLEEDPSQIYEVKGTDGTVGAQYHWNGNEGKDLGYQDLVNIESNSFIGMQCDFQKPFKAKPTFDYSFEQTSNGIKVTQDFEVKSALGDAFFMWLFGAKKGMEKTNERGMALLKKAVENG